VLVPRRVVTEVSIVPILMTDSGWIESPIAIDCPDRTLDERSGKGAS
jgi:hypothetical protein